MSHYAVVAPPFYSHINALEQLAVTLIAQGHRITFFQQIDVKAFLHSEQVDFYPLGLRSHPLGSLNKLLKLAAHPTGSSMFRLINEMAASTLLFCRELPAACKQLAIDGIIVDQMEPGGALVAKKLGIPYVSVACALPLNREPGLPLAVMPFAYQQDEHALKRYATSERIYDWCMRKHDQVVAEKARELGLNSIRQLHHCFSSLAQISQLVPEFDFPRQQIPPHFHAVGPLRSQAAAPLKQSVQQRNTPTTLYASLGTLQGHRYGLFKKLVAANRAAGTQLLLAHCGGLSSQQAIKLARTPGVEVVSFTDQAKAIAQAQLTITHGGMNTVLDSIQQTTPVLVVPLAFDQPGVAARVMHHGIGQRISKFASRKAWTQQLTSMLQRRDFETHLQRVQGALTQAGGARHAANIIVQALSSGLPVVSRRDDAGL